jgi:hypothetical protein
MIPRALLHFQESGSASRVRERSACFCLEAA